MRVEPSVRCLARSPPATTRLTAGASDEDSLTVSGMTGRRTTSVLTPRRTADLHGDRVASGRAAGKRATTSPTRHLPPPPPAAAAAGNK